MRRAKTCPSLRPCCRGSSREAPVGDGGSYLHAVAPQRARCSGRGEYQEGGGRWAAAGCARHDLNPRITEGTQRHRSGQRRYGDGALDQAGELELALNRAAHREFLEGNVDGGRLVDRQHAFGAAGDGLKEQVQIDDP
jgi:hypothetical protein